VSSRLAQATRTSRCRMPLPFRWDQETGPQSWVTQGRRATRQHRG
jgi:hypothetical protein